MRRAQVSIEYLLLSMVVIGAVGTFFTYVGPKWEWFHVAQGLREGVDKTIQEGRVGLEYQGKEIRFDATRTGYSVSGTSASVTLSITPLNDQTTVDDVAGLLKRNVLESVWLELKGSPTSNPPNPIPGLFGSYYVTVSTSGTSVTVTVSKVG